ncbi:MAG: AAA family ATPase, partial [Firmicutes bacterium]|nr:AAA family ATPase [Bacillota bacterium]
RAINLADLNQEECLESQHFPTLSRLVALPAFHFEAVDNLNEAVQRVEQATIKRILLQTNNNKAQTAKILGLNKSVLYRKLKKYNLGGIETS